jgi:hypothetical protein
MIEPRRSGVCAAAGLTVFALAGCATSSSDSFQRIEAVQAQAEIPEDELLDVGIVVLDDGVSEEWDQAELNERGVYPDIRKSETRYFAVLLKRTLEATGQWGAVRVVPKGAEGLDVMVSGEILESNGKDLELQIRAVDSRGREWFDEKQKAEADTLAYLVTQERQTSKRGRSATQTHGKELDPYQGLYNQIANQLFAVREHLDSDDLKQIRYTSQLRFAADLAPSAFGSHVRADEKGRFEVERLPAVDDPLLARIARIKARDDLFVDTLNDHYANFFSKMDPAYDQWRWYSYEEELALEDLERQKRNRTILGIASTITAVVGTVKDNRTIRDVGVIGAVTAFSSASGKGAEIEMSKAAIEELASSFEADVEPALIDVEGRTLRLTGTAQAQYQTWRKLLRELFESETALPVDPNTGMTVTADDPQGR